MIYAQAKGLTVPVFTVATGIIRSGRETLLWTAQGPSSIDGQFHEGSEDSRSASVGWIFCTDNTCIAVFVNVFVRQNGPYYRITVPPTCS